MESRICHIMVNSAVAQLQNSERVNQGREWASTFDHAFTEYGISTNFRSLNMTVSSTGFRYMQYMQHLKTDIIDE